MTQDNRPAVPETPGQRARYDRVIAAATEVLIAGGQEAVQMKDLAQRAGVSLATLYRYFPAKDYVLLAVTLSRSNDLPQRRCSTSRMRSARFSTAT